MKPVSFSLPKTCWGWHDRATAAWVLLSAGTCALGWLLSALGRLNLKGYAISVAVAGAVGALLFIRTKSHTDSRRSAGFRRWLRRWREPLPFLFLVILMMSLAGGALHAPLDVDGTGYRIPRMLHWIQEGHWHWIHTSDVRMNNRGLVSEWLSLPILLFTAGDRGLFLINIASFALLPGLVFQVFSLFGISPRLARFWMWVMPAAFAYAMPAGGIGNDALLAIYVLASLSFARRFRCSGEDVSLYLALISAALSSGGKISNLPLLLPCLVALFPWPPRRSFRPWRLVPAAVLMVSCSFVPLAAINLSHLGDWTGLGKNEYQAPGPAAGLAGNSFQLLTQNFVPPIFPPSDAWNARMSRFVQSSWGSPFRDFEVFGTLPRAMIDETVALGPGIMLLLLVTLVPAGGPRPRRVRPWEIRILIYASWIALLALLASSGLRAIGRIATPYYPLVVAALVTLVPRPRLSGRVMRTLAAVVMLLTVLTMALSRVRPLWPAEQVLSRLQARAPESRAVRSLAASYASIRARHDFLAPFLAIIPAEETRLGMLSMSGIPEHNLSRNPLGRFRVRYFVAGDDPASFRSESWRFLVVEGEALEKQFSGAEIGEISRLLEAPVRSELACQLTPSGPPKMYYLLEKTPLAEPLRPNP